MPAEPAAAPMRAPPAAPMAPPFKTTINPLSSERPSPFSFQIITFSRTHYATSRVKWLTLFREFGPKLHGWNKFQKGQKRCLQAPTNRATRIRDRHFFISFSPSIVIKNWPQLGQLMATLRPCGFNVVGNSWALHTGQGESS